MVNAVSLREQLTGKVKQLGEVMPAEVRKQIGEVNVELAGRFKSQGVAVGAQSPQFSLANADGKEVTLKKLLSEHQAVVLTWYRGGWCPFCNLALRGLLQVNSQLEASGAKLVALTPETPDESASTVDNLGMPMTFEVLSDVSCKVAETYGVAFEVGDDMLKLYKGIGADLAATNGNVAGTRPKLPVPATFVVDKSGKVVCAFVDLDYTKRAEPADVVAAVRAAVGEV